MKGVCFASHCLSAPPVLNVHNAAEKHPVGGRLEKFEQVWLSLVQIRGWCPSGQWLCKPSQNTPVTEKAVEKVVVQSSLAFYNRLFLAPKPQNVGHIPGLERCIFSHFHKSRLQEVSQVSPKWANVSVHCSTFSPSDGSVGVLEGCKGSETYGPGKGYKDPPVPRRLVSQSSCVQLHC